VNVRNIGTSTPTIFIILHTFIAERKYDTHHWARKSKEKRVVGMAQFLYNVSVCVYIIIFRK